MPRNEHLIPNRQRDDVAQTLFRHLLYVIATGKWPEGMRLPSIREAERLFGASRTTFHQAYQALVTHQLVESKPRSGYVVKPQSGDAWVFRNRSKLEGLYRSFSQAIIKSTGLAPLPVLRYITRLADIDDHEHPSCAFVECTSLQAEGHAKEIKDRLDISVSPKTVGDLIDRRRKLPAQIKSVITTHFHRTELLPFRTQLGIELLAVPIEISPLLRKQLALLEGPVILLETEKQMAQDITSDARQLMSDMPISTMTVDSIPVALHKIFGKALPYRNQASTVLLSPRDWGSLDKEWRNHPNVKVVSFIICESSWDSIAEFVGMPIGPLG